MPDRVSWQIADKVRALIAAGSTLAGANVSATRVWPYETLPAVNVYVSTDRVLDDGQQTVGDLVMREALVVTDLRAKANADVDRTLHQLLGQIEVLLFTNFTLDGLSIHVNPEEARFDYDNQEKAVGLASVTWPIPYRIVANDPWTDQS